MKKDEPDEIPRIYIGGASPEHEPSPAEMDAMEKNLGPLGTAALARFFGAPRFGGRDPAEYVTSTLAGGAERRRRALQLAADTACQLIMDGAARALEADSNDAVDAQHRRIEQVLEVLTGTATKTRALVLWTSVFDFDIAAHPMLAPWKRESEQAPLDFWRLFLDRFPSFEDQIVGDDGEVREQAHVTLGNLYGMRPGGRGRPLNQPSREPSAPWTSLLAAVERLLDPDGRDGRARDLAGDIRGGRERIVAFMGGVSAPTADRE